MFCSDGTCCASATRFPFALPPLRLPPPSRSPGSALSRLSPPSPACLPARRPEERASISLSLSPRSGNGISLYNIAPACYCVSPIDSTRNRYGLAPPRARRPDCFHKTGRWTSSTMSSLQEYVRSPRGVQLFTCSWLPPPPSSPKALVFLCHGYGMECSDFMSACGIKLATAGYGVFGIDYEGHGKSMGARCYIQKFENLIADCDRFFKSICDIEDYRNKSRFLYGESMGGAVALLLHRKDPTFWDGAVLVAPMCKISEKVKPHPVVVTLLTQVEEIIPKWKIVPTKDVIDSAFKDPVKREKIRKNKLIYQDKPRLKTALELLRTSMDVEDSLSEVRMPFFILHGEADTVTDPEISRALYDRAASTDKNIKLYPGMWHGLTAGEPDENVEVVFSDIVAWLNDRSRQWKPEERVRTPPEPVNRHMERSVLAHGRPKRRSSFLCGLGGRPHQQQCRM